MGKTGYDVAVLGLGAMGSAAAYHLAQRGQRVLALDRFHPPHEHGSSHGHTRAIRKAYFEDPAYVPLLHRAYESWRRLEKDSGRELLRQTGTLMLGSPESSVVAGSLQSAQEHGLAHQLLDGPELVRRFPQLLPGKDTVGLLEEIGGILAAEPCIEAHLELARRHGADLHFDEFVDSWRELPTRDGVEIVTGRGSYRADRLVLAAGAWNPEMLRVPETALTVSRQVLFWMKPSQNEERFRHPSFPVWVWAPEVGDIFYGFPMADGKGAGIKMGIHTPGELVSPESVDRTVGTADLRRLRCCYEGRLQWLEPEPLDACVCLYTNSPDGHFVVGTHPFLPSVTIASGFSGHGFKFSALMGEIIADLVTDGTSQHPIEIFAPARLGFSREEGAW